MNEMTGHYEGVNLVTLTDRGKYSVPLALSNQRDALAMAGRPDMAGHVRTLEENKVIPRWLSQSKFSEAARLYPKQELCSIHDIYSNGATYVSPENAIEMESSIKQASQVMVENEHGEYIYFQPSWVDVVTYVHPLDQFGANIVMLPRMPKSVLDLQLLWVPVAMVSLVPSLSKETVKAVKTTAEWHGWMDVGICHVEVLLDE